MKKRLNKICGTITVIGYCLLTGGLVSCEDMLDTVPQGQFTAEQLDESSVEGLLAAAYAGLEAHYFGNNEAFAGPSTNWIFDVRSDDAYKGEAVRVWRRTFTCSKSAR